MKSESQTNSELHVNMFQAGFGILYSNVLHPQPCWDNSRNLAGETISRSLEPEARAKDAARWSGPRGLAAFWGLRASLCQAQL